MLLRHVAVAEDLRHEARADGFSRVHWNYGHTAIRVLKKMMTPLNRTASNPATARARMTYLPVNLGRRLMMRCGSSERR